MSTYIKLSTLEYPRYEGDIRLEYSEIREDQTEPDFPCPDTYAKVQQVSPPDIDNTKQRLYELAPIQIDSIWTQQWAVRDLTQQEIDDIAKFIEESKNLFVNSSGNVPNAI